MAGRATTKPDSSREAIALRRVKAIELRVEGKKSVRDIARELGVSPTTVWNDLTALIREETDGVADMIRTAREIESQRLDLWQAKVIKALESTGDIDEQAKLFGILTRISERRAKLLGLDAPIKQDIDVTIGTAQQTAASARAMMQTMFASSQDLGLGPSDSDDEPS